MGIKKLRINEKENQPKPKTSKDEKHIGKEKGGGQKWNQFAYK